MSVTTATLTFRDRGDSQCHGDLEVVDGTADPGASVHGVAEVADVDEPHGDADERDDLGQLLAKLVQLLLQRRALLLRARHLVADLADLRGAGRGHHHAHRLARGNVGTLRRRRME